MVLLEYFYWHFAIAPRGIFEIGANYLRATWHRFLIVQHLQSLFAPWHRRLPSDLGKPKNSGDQVMNFFTDIYIRIIAAAVRLTIVLIGCIAEFFIFALCIMVFLVWVMWPFAAMSLIIRGVMYMSYVI